MRTSQLIWPTLPGALDLLNIFSNKVAFYIGDLGVSEADAAGRCKQWNDQVGSANWVQATTANQPNVVTVTALNSRKGIQGTGTPMTLTGGPDRPAPGTTPTYIWAVVRTDTYASGGNIFGLVSIRYGTTSNTVRTNIGSNGPEVAITNGSTYRMRALFSNNVADAFRVGANTGTGNAGNSNPAAATLFANATPANFGAATIFCGMYLSAAPSAAELGAADNWAFRYYGGSVLL